MIIKVEKDGETKYYLVGEHAEERIVFRKIKEETIAEAIQNPKSTKLNVRGREEYSSDKIKVVIEDDEFEQYDGIIVTVHFI